MNGIFLVGLNHKTAPVELRERCSAAGPEQALLDLRDLAPEAVVVNTCNRFEVYLHDPPDLGAILDWLARRGGVTRAQLEKHCYVRRGRNACKHLFFVASSLDSLVVGETQVRHQVKEAYETARAAGTVATALNQLFQTALRVSKRIAETTGVGRGNVSVAGAAADLAERIFGALDDAAVLVVGAGDTAELVMTHLGGRGVSRFRVANRSPERAVELAQRFGGEGVGLDALETALAGADVLVAAAGAPEPIVTAAAMQRAIRKRRGRPIVAIDIAVPRGVDPRVDKIDNVYRYDMDALEEVTRDALRHRRQEFIQCCTLIDAATLHLDANRRAQRAGPAIAELERTYRELAEEELETLERKLGDVDDAARTQLRRAFHRLVKKFLHMPVRAMRQGDPEESEVIRRVFTPPGREDDA